MIEEYGQCNKVYKIGIAVGYGNDDSLQLSG